MVTEVGKQEDFVYCEELALCGLWSTIHHVPINTSHKVFIEVLPSFCAILC
uniref:Uncharacterized protein n=1 Tax=Arundo donax TaxID=35708 RepID=A0A0A9E9M2_ARUDO